MPADIGPSQLATLKCKDDTGAGSIVMPLHTFTKLFPRRINANGSPRGLKSSMTPDGLQQIQDTPVWNTGYSNRLDSQRTKSCKPSTDTMVHSGHTRTGHSWTPIMCQTWHCGTQLCSQPPEEGWCSRRNAQQNVEKPTKIFKTSNLHPATPKTSSRHIQTDLK